jgi:aspartate carbamoyltransferase catalytic subunit
MNHFLEISDLTYNQVQAILDQAFSYKSNPIFPDFSNYRQANLFYENSTRTRVSFELAAKNLSIPVINLNIDHSSESKGELIEDTLANLKAMGIQLFVIRHVQEGIQKALAKSLGDGIHIINAGDGTHAHPSQAMLDLMTILEYKPDLSKLKIALVGNIKHSRVANSLQCIFGLMGVGQFIMIAPKPWQPPKIHYGEVTDSLTLGLKEADVIICLRVQKERLLNEENLDLENYRRHYAITESVLKYAKPDAIIMHPGPVNRGIELDSSVMDGLQSVILKQVTNGVLIRTAIIQLLLT